MSVPFYQPTQSNITPVITNPNGYKAMMKTLIGCWCYDLKTGGLIFGLICQAHWTFELFNPSEFSLQLLLPLVNLLVVVSSICDIAKKNKLMVSEVIPSVLYLLFLYCVPIILNRMLGGEQLFNEIIKFIVGSFTVFTLIGNAMDRWQNNLFVFWILVAILLGITWYFTTVKYSLLNINKE